MDLRSHKLDTKERNALRTRGRANESLRAIYGSLIDAWLGDEFFRNLALSWIRHPYTPSLFMASLSRYPLAAGPERWLYYVANASAPANGMPCSEADRFAVTPWWNPSGKILVCKTSYRPDTIFDGVGYCAGQPEPTVPAAPRPGCGCGPLLMACLPPASERPTIADDLQRDVLAEVSVTGGDVFRRGRLDDFFTRTTTWQTGLVRALYARRELIADVRASGWSPALEQRYAQRLQEIDPLGPGRWVDRGPAYAGTGLRITTIAEQAASPTYRVVMTDLQENALCTQFRSIRVDSHALLAAVEGNHSSIRSLDVSKSPMRTLLGCKGCHAPMDFGAGFLEQFQTPLFGNAPTGRSGDGKLYVSGADDFRGEGHGIKDLTRLLTQQPEFPRCAVQRLVSRFLGERHVLHESPVIASSQKSFEGHGRNLEATIRSMLESPSYVAPFKVALDSDRSLAPMPSPSGSTTSSSLFAQQMRAAGDVLAANCTDCHDKTHRIDLSVPPERIPLDTWQMISRNVENGLMPPRSDDAGSDSGTQSLDPEARSVLTRTLSLLLARQEAPAPQDQWYASRNQRVQMIMRFASPHLSNQAVEEQLDVGGLLSIVFFESEEFFTTQLYAAAFHVCRSVVPKLPAGQTASHERFIDTMFLATLGRAPTPAEAERDRKRLRTISARSEANADPLATYCAVHLTSAQINGVSLPRSTPSGTRQ